MNELARHYSNFKVTERTLLTGHSHQAWPDVAYQGQMQALLDAADLVDGKWDKAFEKATQLKMFYAKLLEDYSTTSQADNYCLAPNTHELLVRFLSALDWSKGKRIITTDGEFHSMRRQLARLQEEGIEIVRVAVQPASTLTERMKAEINDDTIAIMMSAVMFKDSSIIPYLSVLADAAVHQNIAFLVDAYHALNVVPFTLKKNSLMQAYVVGGGYKYCQFGEGNCFMRIPENSSSRPVITGWYAEFGALEQTTDQSKTAYSKGGDRFHGSTYDPTSHYRACSVIDFFEEQQLTVKKLREISQHQIGILRDAFDNIDTDPHLISRADVDLTQIGGFLALKTAQAPELQKALADNNILTDQRDGYLRLGPAPYLSDAQLTSAISSLGDIL